MNFKKSYLNLIYKIMNIKLLVINQRKNVKKGGFFFKFINLCMEVINKGQYNVGYFQEGYKKINGQYVFIVQIFSKQLVNGGF